MEQQKMLQFPRSPSFSAIARKIYFQKKMLIVGGIYLYLYDSADYKSIFFYKKLIINALKTILKY
jgi:hypothetical protein